MALLILLAVTCTAWVGLTLWREAGIRQMQTIEDAYREYYRERATDAGAPVAVWDFEQQRLVEIPDSAVERVEGSGGLHAVAVRTPENAAPLSAFGLVLARIPLSVWHGLFGIAVISLAALYLVYRRG